MYKGTILPNFFPLKIVPNSLLQISVFILLPTVTPTPQLPSPSPSTKHHAIVQFQISPGKRTKRGGRRWWSPMHNSIAASAGTTSMASSRAVSVSFRFACPVSMPRLRIRRDFASSVVTSTTVMVLMVRHFRVFFWYFG